MKVWATPDAHRRIIDAGRGARMKWIGERAAAINNPLQLGAVLTPLGSGFWKDRIGSERIIAITDRHPSTDEWELIIVDVHRRSSGEVNAGAYRKVLDDLDGTREERRADVGSQRHELLEVSPPTVDSRPAPSRVLRRSDALATWLDLRWPEPRGSIVLLGRQAWDRALKASGGDTETAVRLARAAVDNHAEPGDLRTVAVDGHVVTFVEVPGSLFHADRALLFLDTDARGATTWPDGLREAVRSLQELCVSIYVGEYDPFSTARVFRGLADWQYTIDGRHPVANFVEERVPFDSDLLVELTIEQRYLLDQALVRKPPLFLTGRAGSSKSTLLHHAFARYCVAANRLGLPGEPRFITRRDRLVREAARRVRSILFVDHHLSGSEADVKVVEHAEAWMVTLSEHLRTALPDVEQPRFDRSQYVDFARFRELYVGRTTTGVDVSKVLTFPDHQARDSIEPSLAWFVLRALVKGYEAARDWTDPDDCFGIDDYTALPSDDQVVDAAVFSQVCARVLPWYRRMHLEHGLWDDQDLALAVYRAASLPSSTRIAALVCDEAQDFTRIELLGLVRTICFFDYDLARLPGRALPIVLAGDELQTVHPTAFRWANVTSGFFELTGAAFGPGDARTIDEELLHANFRSTKEVVDVANAVQSVRRSRLGEDHATPQKALRGAGAGPGVFFGRESLSGTDLAAVLSTNVVVVPCAEGRERDFVLADTGLREVFAEIAPAWLNGSAEHASPVYGPHEAKGLEFSTVVLYGWGEQVPEPSRMDPHHSTIDDRARYTNLYVAVTRAAQRLVAIDPRSSLGLWTELVNAITPSTSIDSLREGVTDDLVAVVGDARALAEEMADRGRRLESASELLRAADRFSALNQPHESTRCRAEALALDGRSREAADLFDEIGEHGSAEDCLWSGGEYEALLHRHPATELGPNRQVVARSMTAPSPSAAMWVAFADALRGLRTAGGRQRDPTWQRGLDAYLEGLDTALVAGEVWDREMFGRVVELVSAMDPTTSAAGLPPALAAVWVGSPTTEVPRHVLLAIYERYEQAEARQALLLWLIGETMDLDADIAVRVIDELVQVDPADADAVELELLMGGDPESERVGELVARRVGRLGDALRAINLQIAGRTDS